jgi:hypothetical protein
MENFEAVSEPVCDEASLLMIGPMAWFPADGPNFSILPLVRDRPPLIPGGRN